MGHNDPPIVGGENATPSTRLNSQTNKGTSPSRKPVDAWCDDGSVSRAEPPWLRDRRLKLKGEQRDSLSSRFIRKAATTETTGSTFDSAELHPTTTQTNDNMFSNNNHRNPTLSTSKSPPSYTSTSSPSHADLYKNPYASTPPGALRRPSQSNTSSNPFDSPSATKTTVTSNNPFESPTSIPRFRPTSVRQQQNGINNSPHSSRAPNRRSTNPFDGTTTSSRDEDSSIKDPSVEMDSLDQILDRTDVTVEESTQEGRSGGGGGGGGASAGDNSSQETSLSEKALKAAELLKKSFDQPSLSRTQTSTPSQHSQSRSGHSRSSGSSSARRVTPERYYRKPTTATIPEETAAGSNVPSYGPCPLISPPSSRRQSTTQNPVRPIPQRAQEQQQQQPTVSFSLSNMPREYEEPPPSSSHQGQAEEQKEQIHNSIVDADDDDSFPQESSIVDDDDSDHEDAESYDEVLSGILDETIDPPPNTTYDNNSEMADVGGEEQEVVYMSNDDDNEPRGYSFRDDEDGEEPSDVDYAYSFREQEKSISRAYSFRDDEVAPRGYSFRDEDEDDDVVITIDDDDVDDDDDKIGTDESSRLALHDLCDEARARDDIAWHNALYLLSVKPELCTEREQICQMNPLHVCCLSTAPIWMTRALLYTRPEQCQETDVGGRLPLHLCVAMSADLDTMQLLVQEYPASVSHKDKRGFTPLHLLLKNDQISLTLEHLRILLGQTTDQKQQQKNEAKRLHFRKSEHLNAKLEELEAMKKRQEEHHESMFTDYPEDVQRTLNKITQWKRRQISKGNMVNDTNFVYDYIQPASIPTPAGKLLPLHLLVRRKPSHEDDITRSRIILSSTRRLPPGSTLDLCRVLIHAYPEALITRDAGGRTPLLTAMLQTDSLPSEDVVETLLGLRTSQPLDISPAKFAADDTHQLPLHVAAEEMTSNYELISTICEAYPEGIEKQDLRGRTPLHLALGNYRAIPVDESLLELLTNKHVAKTLDFDGNRPLDWILEHPNCLVQRDDSLVFQQFLDDSIGPPLETNYWEHSNDLIRQMQMLPPWLRRQACTAKYVQAALLEQVTMPKNTFGVLLWGSVLVALLVIVRLLLEEEKTSYILTVYILASYLLARQVVRCVAATFLGEFYAVVLASPWTYVHWVSGLLSILLAHTIASEAAAFEAVLGPSTFETFEKQETLIASLGAFTTAALWLSILGFLVEWWCGMAIAFGSAIQVLKTLFWPFVVAGMGIVAAAQILYTLEDCSDVCPLSETYATVYWTILGEPVLTDDESLPRDTMIVLIVFSVLAVWWLLSVIVLAVSEAQSLDRRQIALQWYWEPKVTLVWTRNAKPIELNGNPSCMQRYCDRMEELWFVVTSLIKGDNNKRRDLHWYASCSRPGFWRCLVSPFALLFILIWLVLGAVTLGLLWPPQVRRWLFATTMISKEKTTPIEDRLTGSKLSQLKGEWHKFQETSMERNARLQDDISQIKDILIRAMLEDEKQS